MPMPASLQGMANSSLADADIGVTPIAGLKGGQATFVGGDAIGISRDSKVANAAWNFLAWMVSDEAQIEVVAKGGNVLAAVALLPFAGPPFGVALRSVPLEERGSAVSGLLSLANPASQQACRAALNMTFRYSGVFLRPRCSISTDVR